MVQFIFFLDATQDRHGIFNGGFLDHKRLETARKGGILFHIFAIFIEGRRTDTVQFTAGQRRFDQIGGIHRTIRFACPHKGVHLIDE